MSNNNKPQWNVNLTFTPPLSKEAVLDILEYLDDHDYVANHGDDGVQWYEMPIHKREGWGTYGDGKMAKAFESKHPCLCDKTKLQKIAWSDTFAGDPSYHHTYKGQDVGKLLRALKKQKCKANGVITGRRIGVNGGDRLFVVDNVFHAPVVTYAPGPKVYEDHWPSEADDDDDEPDIKRARVDA
tara:strand:- start:3866 stop:4417 length:552 start_codon:yes stop_codon:yes gene_type:complete